MLLNFLYKKWYKKIIFCLSVSLFICAPIIKARILETHSSRIQRTKEPITSKNTIFLWDIHRVIVARGSFIKELKKRKNRWAIFNKTKHRFAYVWKALWMKMFSHKSGEAYARLAMRHKNKELAELIKSVYAIIEKPMIFTVNIIKELKSRGYTHYIGSNIGHEFFVDLQMRMPEIFNNDLFDLEGSQLAVYESGKELCKPSPAFFYEFIKKNNIDVTKTYVVFIDDEWDNIKAARKVGFIGIHYKNHMQLRQELRKLKSEFI